MTTILDGVKFRDSFNMPESFRTDGCNGVGSGWSAKFIPNTIYGVSIRRAACIHDWGYTVGNTPADKLKADEEFKHNMLVIVEGFKKWYYPTFLAKRRAYKYYRIVRKYGDEAFFK